MIWNNTCLGDLSYHFSPKLTTSQKKERTNSCRLFSHSPCYYCGGTYHSYDTCNYIENKFVPTCNLCHVITEFAPHYSCFVKPCSSNLTQREIIRKTVDFIGSQHRVPEVLEIDPSTKICKLKPVQFYRLVSKDEHDENIKLFFTSQLSITKIIISSSTQNTQISNITSLH